MKIQVGIPITAQQNYTIHIEQQSLNRIADLVDLNNYSQIAIVTDENIAGFHLEKLRENINKKNFNIILPPGETSKTIDSVKVIWDKLIEAKCDRNTLIINLGGGVICDIGGFAASTYMRGIDFLNIPTTLLSQVDASIGGKTGIDYSDFKNLIGTFNQPVAVIIDPQTLSTLPEREFASGFGEIIKHGLISDRKYFDMVTSKKPQDFSQIELIEIVNKSIQTKKNIVEKDPTEQGERKILNFGHTAGHAIEAISLESNSPLLHGEAISLGMVVETKISQLLGNISQNDVEIIKRGLENAGLPIVSETLNISEVYKKIEGDKKQSNGQVGWTLLKNIGTAVYNQNIKDEVFFEAIKIIEK